VPTTRPFSYSTVSDLYFLAPEVGSLTAIPSADVAGFGGKAQEWVDAKISKLYTLPFATTPRPLQSITEDIALYYLYRRLYTSDRFNASPWPDRYKDAMAMLDLIASGDLTLIDSSGAVVTGRTDIVEVWSNTMGYVPTFSELSIYQTVRDSDKMQDEADRRDLDSTVAHLKS
jgi:phage gp36-like protein